MGEKINFYFHYRPNCKCRIDTCFGKRLAGQTCEKKDKMACGFNFNGRLLHAVAGESTSTAGSALSLSHASGTRPIITRNV